jgi:acyl carrier protein
MSDDLYKTYSAEEVKEQVLDVMCSQLGLQRGQITTKSRVVDDLGADSLDCVEVIMAIEEEFFITIPEDECEHLDTVQSYIDLTVKQLNDVKRIKADKE